MPSGKLRKTPPAGYGEQVKKSCRSWLKIFTRDRSRMTGEQRNIAGNDPAPV